MILEALGNVLGEAVGILLSPLPIAGVILMLFSARWKVNSLSFLVGWLAGLAIVGAIVLSLSSAGDVSSDSDAAHVSGGVLVAIGALLIFGAFRRWRSRPHPGETPTQPRWMARIAGMGPFSALVLGVLFAAVNPKNLLLAAAAAAQIAQVNLSATDTVVTWAIFVLIASIGIIVPIAYRLVRGEHAQATLDRAKVWLEANNSVVLAVVFLVIGAKILGDGLSTLS